MQAQVRRSASALQGPIYLKLTPGIFLNNPNCLVARILEFPRTWHHIVAIAMREIVDQDEPHRHPMHQEAFNKGMA